MDIERIRADLLALPPSSIERPIEIPPEISLLRHEYVAKTGVKVKTLIGGDAVNILEDVDIDCYKRPWSKLENELKINRAMHYIQKLNLTEKQSRQLRILLINAINKRIITKKIDVDYDEEIGELKEICKLQKNADGIYYLENFIPPEKGENGYISHVSELSETQMAMFAISH